MYKIERQMSLAEFITPFGKLDPENRWVKIANMLPWEKYETEYAKQFCDDNGAPATPFRMALGTLIIKQRTGNSDEETLQDIIETPAMQFLIGLHEFTQEAPFCSASITNFRKYISPELLDRINEDMFNQSNRKDDNDDDSSSFCDDEKAEETPGNQGELLLDATCAPADIAYPTDVNLLNEAREKLEKIIDTLHLYSNADKKPRTYRQEARRKYLNFVKNRKPTKKSIRKAIGQQLRYVRRDLSHIERQLSEIPLEALSNRRQQHLETIRKLYAQQEEMHRKRTHCVGNRIVSITQPWVRPIVRGKAKSDCEFGAKISASMVNGYVFNDKLSWDAYSEAADLIPAVEAYKKKHGFYPQAVIADKLYRNRQNLAYCKGRGIRLSGPRLGRPSKLFDKQQKRQERQDAATRNAIEGKFGEGKTRYGLDRIMARLQHTSETVVSLVFLCINISRRLRLFLSFLWTLAKRQLRPVDNFLQSA
jgi:hypothetical protein